LSNNPIWLHDSRLLLISQQGKLYLVDRVTKEQKVIHSIEPDYISGHTLTRDNRTLYYSHRNTDTDLRLLT
jgi:hypothetical protein